MSDDRAALIAEARIWPEGSGKTLAMMLDALADALEASVQAPAVDREALIEGFAKAMNAIEARTHGKTMDDVARMRENWRRHLYEAERLIEELADFGITDWLDAAEVEARGLEEAADAIPEIEVIAEAMRVWLRSRAQHVREGK